MQTIAIATFEVYSLAIFFDSDHDLHSTPMYAYLKTREHHTKSYPPIPICM